METTKNAEVPNLRRPPPKQYLLYINNYYALLRTVKRQLVVRQ